MIDFFAILFLIAIIGVIVFGILSFFFDSAILPMLVVICLLVAFGSGIGMEVEKAKEPNACECECTCCSVYEKE